MSTNRDVEFNRWWYRVTGLHTEFPKGPMETCKIAWDAAYAAGRAVESANADAAHSRGRADERAGIERRLLAMAAHAFIANKDEHAHWFRSLVNVLFKNPGDPSA